MLCDRDTAETGDTGKLAGRTRKLLELAPVVIAGLVIWKLILAAKQSRRDIYLLEIKYMLREIASKY